MTMTQGERVRIVVGVRFQEDTTCKIWFYLAKQRDFFEGWGGEDDEDEGVNPSEVIIFCFVCGRGRSREDEP